jgi:hypothetical protein
MRALALVATGLALCLLGTACDSGPRHVKVSGQIVRDDKAIRVPPRTRTQVMFIAMDESGQKFPALVNREDFSFEVTGPKGDGIPPGKYRVSIQQWAAEPSAELTEMNKRFSQESSPVIREVPADEAVTFKIDLVKDAK